ncbi:hypothetical protein CALCODRAFT_155858 [Calocera cornea HHB12733]|uniref:Uncharacterized protein n=1 Tax=Calocera cornea HHB12733 TaxID=1353952 RepID=A0A165HZ53_9BASI|nr:hypothetical protein CALCODRAFT_155858 [Calocera cornea HHB12733]
MRNGRSASLRDPLSCALTGKEVTYHVLEVPDAALDKVLKLSNDYWLKNEIPAPLLLELGVKFHQFDEFVVLKAHVTRSAHKGNSFLSLSIHYQCLVRERV